MMSLAFFDKCARATHEIVTNLVATLPVVEAASATPAVHLATCRSNCTNYIHIDGLCNQRTEKHERNIQ